jgi:hypothetical protein
LNILLFLFSTPGKSYEFIPLEKITVLKYECWQEYNNNICI